MNIVT